MVEWILCFSEAAACCGVYLLRITDMNGMVYTDKITKQ